MSLTFTQLSALGTKFYEKKLADGIYNSAAAVMRMTRPEKLNIIDGGLSIVKPLINSKPGSTSGGYYDGRNTLAIEESDNITASEYQWKYLYESIRIFQADLDKNSGSSQQVKLLESKYKIAKMNMTDKLATGLFSDGTAATGALTANQITGMRAMISTSSTYGGIAVADMAEWVAVVKANGGTNRPLSLNLIQQAMGAATQDSEKPTVAYLLQNVYDQLWSLIQPAQRIFNGEMGKLGFENILEVNGVPFIVDSHMKANSIFFLNENHVELTVHKNSNMRIVSHDSLESSDSMLKKIFWSGNLTCSNRRFQAELADIEVAA